MWPSSPNSSDWNWNRLHAVHLLSAQPPLRAGPMGHSDGRNQVYK
jgi:hypothetical protein